MIQIRWKSLIALIAAPLLVSAAPDPAAGEGQWERIFNGRDLTGWTPKIRWEAAGEDRDRTFIVQDGAIRVSYDRYDAFKDRFGHLFYKEPLRYFRLRFRYRFVGEGLADGPKWARSNSGIMFLAQPPAQMAVDQEFPVSIEYQLLGDLVEGPRPTGNICTPGTLVDIAGKPIAVHCIPSSGPTLPNGNWVEAELDVLPSGEIVHRINGQEVLRYSRARFDPEDKDVKRMQPAPAGEAEIQGGYLALQSESHPIEFKDIEIQRLAP